MVGKLSATLFLDVRTSELGANMQEQREIESVMEINFGGQSREITIRIRMVRRRNVHNKAKSSTELESE